MLENKLSQEKLSQIMATQLDTPPTNVPCAWKHDLVKLVWCTRPLVFLLIAFPQVIKGRVKDGYVRLDLNEIETT